MKLELCVKIVWNYQASRAFFVSGQAQHALHGGFFSTTLGLFSKEHAAPSSPHGGAVALGVSILAGEVPIISTNKSEI